MDPYAHDLKKFIADNFLFGEPGAVDSLADDESLIDTGIIDSTGVLELVGYLEQRYGITVRDDELVPENLDSIVRLTRFLERKSRPQSSAGAR